MPRTNPVLPSSKDLAARFARARERADLRPPTGDGSGHSLESHYVTTFQAVENGGIEVLMPDAPTHKPLTRDR